MKTMNLTPREKAKAFIIVYAALFGLFIIGGFLWNLFPHIVLGIISIVGLCGGGTFFIFFGLKQLREARSNGQVIAWYQQYVIMFGLTILCLLLSGSIIVICIAIIHAYPSRLMDYLLTIICILAGLPVFVLGYLAMGANPFFTKSTPAQNTSEHTEQATNDQH
jgi:hypothetical protein